MGEHVTNRGARNRRRKREGCARVHGSPAARKEPLANKSTWARLPLRLKVRGSRGEEGDRIKVTEGEAGLRRKILAPTLSSLHPPLFFSFSKHATSIRFSIKRLRAIYRLYDLSLDRRR